ncbi:MAG TPA: NADH-quinone oxidoreductase subunit J [Pirellulales bacterium]
MSHELIALALATVLGAAGMWLLLPRGRAGGRRLGLLLALAGLGVLAWQVPPLGDWASDIVFYILALVTVVAAAAAVTFRNPVYCAIWFALSLLGTAGLFLLDGAQFLGVATVVVYAGAILVTFLFVLMLAQPEGDAFYDRLSWDTPWAALTGMVLVGLLTLAVVGVFRPGGETPAPVARFTAQQLEQEVLAPQHMAHLGRELFSHYLFAVEIGGTLLLVALVGAVAILAESARQMPPSAKSAHPRLDPRIVNSRDLQNMAPPLRRVEPAGEEVTHG